MNHWELYGNKSYQSNLNSQQSFEFNFIAEKTNPVSINQVQKLNSVLPTSIWPVDELSEIRCKKNEKLFHLLLPLLSKLSSEKRWITLISPPMDIDKKLFAYHGIDVSRILLIHPNDAIDDTTTMNKALKNGTSGIVILWSDNLKKRFVAQWRKSVKQGSCRGIIINHDSIEHGSRSIALTLMAKASKNVITVTSIQKFGKMIKNGVKHSFPIINAGNSGINQIGSDNFLLTS